MAQVEIDVSGRVGRLILNRPEKRNALDDSLVNDLSSAIVRLGEDPTVKVVILQARGEAFCAGADLAYLQRLQKFTFEQNLDDSRRMKDLFLSLHQIPKPTIAQVEGPALAGGCGLVSLCDFAVAGPKAQFGYTEVRIGFIPALVSVFLVRKLGEGAAARLLLSGEIIDRTEAHRLGLVSHISEDPQSGAEKIAEMLTSRNSGEAMHRTKTLLHTAADLPLAEALELASRSNAEARGTTDCRSGIEAFLSRKPISW
jgi:methylglutaconyl-CoA hydratase